MHFSNTRLTGDRSRGGGQSPKTSGGVKIFEFPGVPEIDPFLRLSIEILKKIANLGSKIGDRKGTTKRLCDKDFAERSGELSGVICLKILVLLVNDPVAPLDCSENSLVLFV